MGSPIEHELILQNTDDDQCIFMASTLLDQAENLDEWLSKNGHFLITNENTTENLIDEKLDPLLNQVNADSCLDSLSDSEVAGDDVKGLGALLTIANPSSEIDDNMNTLHKIKKQNKSTSNSNKLYLLESRIKAGLNILLSFFDNKLFLSFYDNHNTEVLSQCTIELTEVGGQTLEPKEKQPVIELSKVEIAHDTDIAMPRLLTELGLYIYLCPLGDCTIAFLRLGTAKLHALVHVGHKPFRCTYPDCTWAFYTSCKLKRHQETHSKKKDYVCPLPDCLRRFTTIYNLNNHKRLHERPADLPCPVKDCDEKFQTARARERHLKSHDSSEAPYHCPVSNCNKSFFLNTALTVHVRTHTQKESDLRCQYPNCGKVFEQPCRLKEHSRKHTGQRPFCCTFDDCKWTFPTSSKLKRHQSIHTNELCAASFLGKSSLYLHIKKSHPEQHQACARALPFSQTSDKPSADALLEQAIQSLGVPSDMILGTELLPEEPLELLGNENFSTVNLRDLD